MDTLICLKFEFVHRTGSANVFSARLQITQIFKIKGSKKYIFWYIFDCLENMDPTFCTLPGIIRAKACALN